MCYFYLTNYKKKKIKTAKLGANAILGVSLAIAKAGAARKKVPLYKHLADLAGNKDVLLPVPVSYCIRIEFYIHIIIKILVLKAY